jgi:hypothetical protein
MAEQQEQDSSKTFVSFIVGILIGGMLVWAFSGGDDTVAPNDDVDTVVDTAIDGTDTDTDTEGSGEDTPTSTNVSVSDQPAGATVTLDQAIYPVSEGWVAVQDYDGETFATILGAVQFSESADIAPNEIPLQFPTSAGRQYAIVIYESDGVAGFDTNGDTRLEEVFGTFVAQ